MAEEAEQGKNKALVNTNTILQLPKKWMMKKNDQVWFHFPRRLLIKLRRSASLISILNSFFNIRQDL